LKLVVEIEGYWVLIAKTDLFTGYTADEEDEKALVRQQQAPVGLHFGRPLDESLSVSEQAMHLHIIEKAIAYIRSKSLKTEGAIHHSFIGLIDAAFKINTKTSRRIPSTGTQPAYFGAQEEG
jgi:hypothetical protein